jgi:hypothetical protein
VAILTTMTRRPVGIDRLARRRHNSLNPSCFPQRAKAVKEIDVANETARVVRFDSVGGAEVLKIQKWHGLQAAGRPTCLMDPGDARFLTVLVLMWSSAP